MLRKPDQPVALGRAPEKRSLGVSYRLFYGAVAVLMLTNAFTLVGFLMSPDIAGLFSNRNERIAAAYEDRIVQLRLEVDRLQSRQYAQTGDLNLQMQELVQQQEVLAEQHQYVRALADKAAELGILTAEDTTPAPEPALSRDGLTGTGGPDLAPDIDAVRESVDTMMGDTRNALQSISSAANSSADEILGELDAVGIRPKLTEAGIEAMGGPFEPALDADAEQSIADDTNAAITALARFRLIRGELEDAPVHKPLAHLPHISSGFGNRRDPFVGSLAFHAGLDFPSPSGTSVLSAGAGTVSFAGHSGGYGNMVEVTHPGGLVTRYGHLSKILVSKGDTVGTGSVIGKVGSTGRSTGPHLHFEVRRNQSPTDPSKFLAAGKRLARFL